MTKTELKNTWAKALEYLSESLDKIKVDNFFKPLSAGKLSEREGILYLVSPKGSDSNFYIGMVARYPKELRDAIFKAFGKNYNVQIIDKELPEDAEYNEENFLNPKYTFDSFVGGSNSQVALAASIAVAQSYSNKYNPLFIYGGSGLGKTHLMHAIGHYVLQNKPRKKVLYVSSEKFTTELIDAIQNKTQAQIKNKYRNLDYLLFDDVQFIAGKDYVEEELFNTFDALHDAGKQIVFTSDKPPKDLGNIPERLTSRFSQGIIVDIKSPDYETRMAILKNKATLEDLDINDESLLDSLDIIAQNIQSNIRELEGAFTRVVSFSQFTGKPITRELTKEVLTDVFKTREKEITPELIKKTVANYYNLKVSDLESSKRARDIAYPRQIAMYLIRTNTNYSLPKIGEFFGGRDHTTVLHSIEKIESEVKTVPQLKSAIDNIERLIRE